MTKTALITGATAGFGAAAARRFAAEGWKVVGTGRRSGRLEAIRSELGADVFHPLPLDMRAISEIPAAVSSLPSAFRDIDLLINNAGLAPPMAPLQEAEIEASVGVIETNITGLLAMTRALLPGLIERRGAIINLSSVAANYPYRGGAVYGGTKAFVSQFSLDLRCDLHGTGVRVTAIEPGMAETEFTIVRNGGDQAASDALYAGIDPMTAEDLAETLWWVANLPSHVNINTLELMPVNQSFAGFALARIAEGS